MPRKTDPAYILRMFRNRAVVVGAGPNGLAAAVVLARAGMDVTVFEAESEPGGATRSAPVFGPGTIVDLGSAAHPLGVSSPFLRSLDLERHGLRWIHPDIPAAHPLDGRPAALLHTSLDRTVAELGRDGRSWRRLVGASVRHWDRLVETLLGPLVRIPRDPLVLGDLGVRGVAPATVLARLAFSDEPARALFAGCAAHSFVPLHHSLTSAFGVLLAAAAHARGWPVAAGGSQAIARALVAELEAHGGRVVTDHPVTDLAAIGPADLTLLDIGPRAALDLLGDRLSSRIARAFSAWRYGPSAHKVDYLLDGPVPWSDQRVGAAGTVHLGGTMTEIAAAESEVARGRHPERPFVLLCQQGVADATRAPIGQQVVYAYAHTPRASADPATGQRIDAQIERFAPGFRDRIIARVETPPAALERLNRNLVGGDIIGGSIIGSQQVLRPRATLNPYALGIPGVFLCSASTPPGGGVHGMSGYHAARAALASLHRGSPAKSDRQPVGE